MLNWTSLAPQSYEDFRYAFLLNVEENGVEKLSLYSDTQQAGGNPTIGCGFNLTDATVLSAVLTKFNFDLTESKDRNYRDLLSAELNKGWSTGLQAALDAIMLQRANDPAITWDTTKQTTFNFTAASEVRNVVDRLAPVYNQTIDNWLSGVPETQERAVLFSLAWNQKSGSPLLGSNLKTAIQTGIHSRTAEGSPSQEVSRSAASGRALACAAVFVAALLSVPAPLQAEPVAPEGQPESLRQVIKNGRPGNLFTLSVNNAELCQSLQETFNQPYSKPDQFLTNYPPYFSDLLLKSPLSIEWEMIQNVGVSSISIGRADVNNDGQLDWLSEHITWTNIWPGYNEGLYWFAPPKSVQVANDLDPQLNKDAYKIIWGGKNATNFISPNNPAKILKVGKYSAEKGVKDKKFIASEIAIVNGTTFYLSTILPMGDKSPRPWTIRAYQMRSHSEGDLLCELSTHNFIQDAIY